jgi:hypothetical protein
VWRLNLLWLIWGLVDSHQALHTGLLLTLEVVVLVVWKLLKQTLMVKLYSEQQVPWELMVEVQADQVVMEQLMRTC